MKPFILDMMTTVVVMADSPEHAVEVANENRREIVRDGELDVDGMPRELVALCGLRGGLDGDCIPYGGDGNTRLKDLMTPNAKLQPRTEAHESGPE